MTLPRRPALPAGVPALALLLALASAPGTALAQFKVVGPDGRVTYTDRPPADAPPGQVQPMRRDGAPAAAAAALPAELQPLAARFPVTLYTGTDCTPCDAARKLLQQRGIPYSERVASSDDDVAALQRLTGGRTVPALTVGSQALRGFLESDWQATLDLAGYPKESRLPRGWQPPPPVPLVARTAAEAAAPRPAAPPAEAPAATAPAGSTPGIRF